MPKFDINLLYYKLPPLLYAALILSLSLLSATPAPHLGISWEDKIYHFFEYLIFGLLVFRAFPGFHEGPKRRLNAILLLTFCLAWAGLDETVQYFVPSRDSSLTDWLADALGAGAALVIYLWWKAKPKHVPDADKLP